MLKIGEFDLIDIDCIDQSVEIDDGTRFVHRFIVIFADFIDLYRKIHLSSRNGNWIDANS